MSETVEILYKSAEEFDVNMPRIMKQTNEVAKKVAIEFAHWLNANNWREYDGEGRWICFDGNQVRTTEQLYEMFELPF